MIYFSQYWCSIFTYRAWCTTESVTFLRNDTKGRTSYYEGALAKNSSPHCVTRCRIHAYQISIPLDQFLISHKFLFCSGSWGGITKTGFLNFFKSAKPKNHIFSYNFKRKHLRVFYVHYNSYINVLIAVIWHSFKCF